MRFVNQKIMYAIKKLERLAVKNDSVVFIVGINAFHSIQFDFERQNNLPEKSSTSKLANLCQ